MPSLTDRMGGVLIRYPWFSSFLCVAALITAVYYQAWLWIIVMFLAILSLAWHPIAGRHARGGALLLVAGCWYFSQAIAPLPAVLDEYPQADVTGVVASIPNTAEGCTRFTLASDQSDPLLQRIQVVCRFAAGVEKGDRIKISGSLTPPRRPGNPGEFDYRRYLYHQGIYYGMTVKNPGGISKIEPARGYQAWVNRYRSRIHELTDRFLTHRESAVLRGMLLGETEDIDSRLYDQFQNTGIVHLFSVSGLHVGFLLLFAGSLSSLIGTRRWVKMLTGILMMLVYGSLISWPVSVVRASIMGTLGLLAYYSGRSNQLLNSLGLAGLVILIFDPQALFTISFQLSFLATWGLIFVFPIVRQRCQYKGWLADAVLLPACAQLAVLPLIAYYFNLLSPVAVLTNLLITYLAGGAVMLGFAALCLTWLPGLAGSLLFPAGLLIEIMLVITALCSRLPGGIWWVATPASIFIGIYYLGFMMLMAAPALSRYSRHAAGMGGVCLLFFLGAVLWPASYRDRGQLEIVFLDVGQGDAILVKSPQGRFILVDGGGSEFYPVGEMKVLPYLRHRGIGHLDMMINTHPDTDHLRGLEELWEMISVDRIACPRALKSSPRYISLFNKARQASVPIWAIHEGQTLQVEEGLVMEVLYPGVEMESGAENNRASLVLRCCYGTEAILLTGDIDKQGIENLLKKKQELKSSLVKVPHHGSRNSLTENLYSSTHCQWAVISVGNNRFGHPHPEVLDELHQQGIQTYRTDRQGAIIYRYNGKTAQIQSFKSFCE